MAKGRDDKGRFSKGWQGGPGRPRNGNGQGIKQFRKLCADAVPEVVNAMIDGAKAGDTSAARIILDRLFPIHAAAMLELAERIEQLEQLQHDNQR